MKNPIKVVRRLSRYIKKFFGKNPSINPSISQMYTPEVKLTLPGLSPQDLMGAETLNPKSVDPSKLLKLSNRQIVRICEPNILKILARFPNYFFYEGISSDAVYIRPVTFHNGPSCWSSAQVSEYLNFMREFNSGIRSLRASLQDGHPWNCIFEHNKIYHIDFGSIIDIDQNTEALQQSEEYRPLEKFYKISYVQNLRRKLAEEVHGETHFGLNEVIAAGFDSLSANDCHTSLIERYRRVFEGGHQQQGFWIGYRGESKTFEDLYSADARLNTLEKVLRSSNIKSAVDIGSNDGLHSYFMAKEFGVEVLSLEYEDFHASTFFNFLKDKNLPITSLCSSLEDYLYHLNYINGAFHPSIEFAILFAVYHHLCHDFGYTPQKLFAELSQLGVKKVLLEFVDYTDIHLCKRQRLDGYSIEALVNEANLIGWKSDLFDYHEQGRRLVLFSI